MPAVPKAAPSSASRHAAPEAGGSGPKHAAKGQTGRDARQLGTDAAVAYSASPGGKKSVAGGATRGALGGAATGATVGSIVPGVGTAVGAGVGAAVGGVAGGAGAHKANKAAARAMRSGAQKLLVAEFVVCMIILALSPLTTDKMQAKNWMKKGTAMSALFLILGLVSSGSPAVGRVCASFGGLVTLVLLVDQRALFTVIAKKLQSSSPAGVAEGTPPDEDESAIEARPVPNAQPPQQRRVVPT